jgi:hypothetical protein
MDVEDKEALLQALGEQRAEPPAVRVGYQNSALRRDATAAPRRETRASKVEPVIVPKSADLLGDAAKLPSLFDLVKKQPHLAYAVQLSAALSLGDEDQDVPSQTIVPQPRPDAPTILTASTLAYFFQFALAKCGINIDNGAESSSEDDVMHHDDSAPPEDDKAGKDSVVLRGKAKKQRDKGAVIQRSAQDRWIGAAQARRKIYHASSEPAAEEDDQVQPMQDAPLPGQQGRDHLAGFTVGQLAHAAGGGEGKRVAAGAVALHLDRRKSLLVGVGPVAAGTGQGCAVAASPEGLGHSRGPSRG